MKKISFLILTLALGACGGKDSPAKVQTNSNAQVTVKPIKNSEVQTPQETDSKVSLDPQTRDEVSKFSSQLGIAIDLNSDFPNLVWPKLRQKLEGFKSNLKARNKYIKYIRAMDMGSSSRALNMTDFFDLGGTLFVNVDRDTSYLKTALAEIDQSKVFLESVKNISVSIKPDLQNPNPYKDAFFTIEKLGQRYQLLNSMNEKQDFKSLTIKESTTLKCDFTPLQSKEHIVILALDSDPNSPEKCTVDNLLSRILRTYELQDRIGALIYENKRAGPSTFVPMGPSDRSLNILEQVASGLAQKSETIHEIVFDYDIDKPQLTAEGLLRLSNSADQLKELQKFIANGLH